MRCLTAAVALAVAFAACVPRGGSGPDGRDRTARSVSVTVYSAPPAEEDTAEASDGIMVLGPGGDWEARERLRKRDLRRVATQMRIFAELSEEDAGVVPYGVGIVKDEREVVLPAGRSEYRFTDVARYIEPETVHFRCVAPSRGRGRVDVLEQSFEYDLASAEAILDRYVDSEVTVGLPGGGRVSGRLLAVDNDDMSVILETAPGRTEIVDRGGAERMLFSALPAGLVTKPTLAWLVETRRGGRKRISIAYRTRGLVWEAGYTAVLSVDGKAVSLSGVATIANASGARYEDARLKLVAGEVNLVKPMELLDDGGGAPGLCLMGPISLDEQAAERFEEKRLFEYHMYTLGRRCTIGNNEVKQIELFTPAAHVPVAHSYVYCGLRFPRGWSGIGLAPDRELRGDANTRVDVYLTLVNDEAAGLGMPLPAGPLRVMKRDPADGEPEFVGETEIDHTPKDEELTVRLGSAFDIVGTRRRTDFVRDRENDRMEETIEIALRNHKDEPVVVDVKEVMYRWLNWEIIKCTAQHFRGRQLPKSAAGKVIPSWHAAVVKGMAGRTRVSFEFKETRFDEAVERFKKLTGGEIAIDEAVAVRDIGPVTLETDDVEAPEALAMLVDSVDLHVGLKAGRLLISANPATFVVEREYDLAGLGSSGVAAAEAIYMTVAPGSWAAELGTSIEERDGRLIVLQRPEVHAKIERLLADWRTKLDSRTVVFPVAVPANGEKTFSYTVKYTW